MSHFFEKGKRFSPTKEKKKNFMKSFLRSVGHEMLIISLSYILVQRRLSHMALPK